MSTTSRGLGWSHQKRRAALLRNLIDGTPCGECGLPMYRTQPLDADHTVPRSQGGTMADRLLHTACNRSSGGKLGRAIQTADAAAGRTGFRTVVTSRDW